MEGVTRMFDDYSPITWARFWSKVSIPSKAHHALECWNWTGSTAKGYGQIKIDGEVLRAPRVALEMFEGPLPDGVHVLHQCDNPLCCNPRHLRAGTHEENMADKVAKGRQAKGAVCAPSRSRPSTSMGSDR